MEIRESVTSDKGPIQDLFRYVFSESAGELEGKIVSELAAKLMETTSAMDLVGFLGVEEGRIAGTVLFSRMPVGEERNVFLLSPLAIHPDLQGKGCGQKLVRYGLRSLQAHGCQYVVTYGDPNFYGKIGFESISTECVRAPFALSQPEGWLGLAIGENSLDQLHGDCSVADAFNDPSVW